MVGVAQLVEPWIVAPVVEGSNPFAHPIFFDRKRFVEKRLAKEGPLAQLAEQLTLNQRVPGSSPGRPTTGIDGFRRIRCESGETGRRAGFRCQWGYPLESSSLSFRTIAWPFERVGFVDKAIDKRD